MIPAKEEDTCWIPQLEGVEIEKALEDQVDQHKAHICGDKGVN